MMSIEKIKLILLWVFVICWGITLVGLFIILFFDVTIDLFPLGFIPILGSLAIVTNYLILKK